MFWRGAREKYPKFFSYFSPSSQTKATLSWIGNVVLFVLHFLVHHVFFLCFNFFCTCFISHSFLNLIYWHFVVLRGSIIACRSNQRHIVAFESNIDIFKSILLPFCKPEQKHTSHHAAPQRGLVFAAPPSKMEKCNFNLLSALVCSWLLTCLFACLYSWIGIFGLCSFFGFLILYVQSSN